MRAYVLRVAEDREPIRKLARCEASGFLALDSFCLD